MCSCVFSTCVWLLMLICAPVCGGLGLILGIFLYHCLPCLQRQTFILPLELCRFGYCSQPVCSCPPKSLPPECWDYRHAHVLADFMWALGIHTVVPSLASQALSSLSYFPNPRVLLWKESKQVRPTIFAFF